MKTDNFSAISWRANIDRTIYRHQCTEQTAFDAFMEGAKFRGWDMPFSTLQEFKAFEASEKKRIEAEEEHERIENEFMQSIMYSIGSPEHAKAIFHENFKSYLATYSENEAFEGCNRVNPGVFKSFEDYRKYSAYLRGYTPQPKHRLTPA